jgi:hypothetical protein
MPDTTLLGRLLWYELMTTDTAAAERFYTDAVGWSTAPFEAAPGPYTMWMRPGGVPVGGMMALTPELRAHGVPPHWMMYVGVPALEEAVGQVERLGGKALSPVITVPTVGRMRTMADPQGAAFSIYEPESPPEQPEAPAEIGDVSWHELYTTDGAAALDFYGSLFGWRATESMDMGPMGVYRMFGRTLGSIGGIMTKTPDMARVPTAWLIYVRVPDVHAAAERVKRAGGSVINGPMEVPGGSWIVQCTDPQGATFAMHHQKA